MVIPAVIVRTCLKSITVQMENVAGHDIFFCLCSLSAHIPEHLVLLGQLAVRSHTAPSMQSESRCWDLRAQNPPADE
jgi:hypothetical protein